MSHQSTRTREAITNIGRRCRWADEGSGTIIAVQGGINGWPNYLIEWDDHCPPWWSDLVSASNSSLIIEDVDA